MTSRERRLLDSIRALSQQLGQLADKQIPLTDPAMVGLSRQLDALIIEWYEVARNWELDPQQ